MSEEIEELEKEKRRLEGGFGKLVRQDPMKAVRALIKLHVENNELKEENQTLKQIIER